MPAANLDTKSPAIKNQAPASPVTDLAPMPGAGQHVLVQSEGGRLAVHHDVVSKIVGLAVREVPGVHALAPHGAGDRISNLADRLTGNDSRSLGVNVELGTVECAADVYIVCDYGVDMPAVAAAVRDKVCERVERMTGLKVRELNVEVVDLFFPDTKTNARNLR